MSSRMLHVLCKAARRCLVGRDQRWVFERPPPDWVPPRVERTSLYLHVPFCRHGCPYCPYTKVPFRVGLVEPYTQAALAEVDWWSHAIGYPEATSLYIGGGTPTLALESVSRIITRMRERFRLTGDICIETNPGDVSRSTIEKLHETDVSLVSLGVQSFLGKNLASLGRDYEPDVAERALGLLAEGEFASVNVDLMFALPGQTEAEIVADLERAAQLGATQITTYPLFTFPYSTVGEYLKLKSVRMPVLTTRRNQYRAIHQWCAEHDFQRVSVWGFRRGSAPRYSSVTRDGYVGIGPGAGSHLPDGFVLNTFDLESWMEAAGSRSTIALRMPFTRELSGWWWLYWRLYDTHVPMNVLEKALGNSAARARRLLRGMDWAGLAVRRQGAIELTERGAFWIHLVQNHFALDYVNTIWTAARRDPWPKSIRI